MGTRLASHVPPLLVTSGSGGGGGRLGSEGRTRMAWRIELKIKDLLSSEDVDTTRAQELGVEVAYRLHRDCAFAPAVTRQLAKRFREVGTQGQFNEAMVDLYDAADAERVWIT